MKRMPKIGERVRYAGSSIVGPCTGTVEKLYPSHVPAPGQDEDDDDCRYVRAPFSPEGWRVSFKYDEKPTPFVYGDSDGFAPSVSEIEPL